MTLLIISKNFRNPNFKDLKLSKEELFDLCQLSSNDKKDIDSCIEDKLKN